MAKKKDNPKSNAKSTGKDDPKSTEIPMAQSMQQLPKDVQEKINQIKGKIEIFQKKIVEKFDKYIMGVALLPPPRPEEIKDKNIDKDAIHVLVLVDDSDSRNMSKDDLKNKLFSVIDTMAQDVDKKILPQVIILSELWQNCYDAKYEVLQLMAMSAPIYDTGMLSAIRIAEIHKNMILKKFEKYIVSYVLAGSLTQGRATPTSDIDVWVVIDDTDVKKMTRAELKDKLRAIIIGMGIEAGELTGVRNKLNIQVYILTDFWDSLKEANPVIFTLLRDGVPFYDRGMFMPWKQLLKLGKIKPSAEAIDMFMGSGEQMLQRAHFKIKEIGMEDTFYAILTPSQAALMMYGVTPPTPKETPELMRELFVKKEKLLEEEFVKILETNINVRKELEHGSKKDLSGKEVDKLISDAERFLKRIQKLFNEIESRKSQEDIVHIYDTALTVARDILRLEGCESVTDDSLIKTFDSDLVCSGKVPKRFLRILNELIKAKKDYDQNKLSKNDVENAKKNSREFVKYIVEHIQRKRARELDRARIRVKHGDKYGEVLLLGNKAFVVHDIDKEEREVSKGMLDKSGSISGLKQTNLEEFEKEIAKVEIPDKVFIKEKTFEDIKKIFGTDVSILVNY